MDQRTHALLALLGSDAAAAVLDHLADSPRAKTDLASATGMSSREVARVLEMLLLVGLVRHRRKSANGRGRPPEVWELADGGELAKLDSYLRSMRHRLIDGWQPDSD